MNYSTIIRWMHRRFSRLFPPLFLFIPLTDSHHRFGRLQQREDQSRVSLIILSGRCDGRVRAVQLMVLSVPQIRPFVAGQLKDQDQNGEESERRRKKRIVVEKLDSRVSTSISGNYYVVDCCAISNKSLGLLTSTACPGRRKYACR